MLRTEVGDWELTPEELAMIFAMKKWFYGTEDCQGIPGPEDIEDIVEHLADYLEGDDRVAFSTIGRMMVVKHMEFNESLDDGDGYYDGSLDVYLHVGNIPTREA